MAKSLREMSKEYIPQKTLNIADLEIVNLDVPIEERTGTDNEGKEFTYHAALVNGREYRVPSGVLKDIKTILEAKPTLKIIKVIKKGSGMNTEYTIIPIE